MTASKTIRVLVIDDHDLVRQTLVDGLGQLGLEAVGADSAIEGLEVVKQEPFSVVVSDVLMPEMDGFELLAALSELAERPKVVMMSGGQRLEPDRYLGPAKLHGADAVITKPFTVGELVEVIQKLMGEAPG